MAFGRMGLGLHQRRRKPPADETPANAILTEEGAPILTEEGAFILQED